MSREGRPVHTGDVEGKGIRRASLARRRDRDVLRRVAQQGAASSWLHKKALRESRKVERNYIRLERKIAEMPADTIVGMWAKIRRAHGGTVARSVASLAAARRR